MLEQSKQQHDRTAEQSRQQEICPDPCFAAHEQDDERRVDEDAGSCAPFELAERVFGGEAAGLWRELSERVSCEHFSFVDDERDAADFEQPSLEGHGGIEGHLAVFADMPSISVVAGVGVSAVVGLFEIEEGANPQAGFVEPASAEGCAVRAFVADGVGGDGENATEQKCGGEEEQG